MSRFFATLGLVLAAGLLAGAADPFTGLPLAFSGTVQGHEGHDHGATPSAPPPSAVGTQARGEAAGDTFELVAVASGARLTLHLDRFDTNEPVADAVVEVETSDGPRAAAPAGPGTYTLDAPWLAAPGHHAVTVVVSGGAGADILTLSLDVPEPVGKAMTRAIPEPGVLNGLATRLAAADPAVGAAAAAGFLAGVVAILLVRMRRIPAFALVAFVLVLALGGTAVAHEGHDHGTAAGTATPAALPGPGEGVAAGGERPRRLVDGAIHVPKTVQRLLALRTRVSALDRHRGSVELPGRVIPDPNASGVVQSSVGGRLAPPPGGMFPRLGTRVRRGEVLATVTAPIQAVDVSDMRQRQGELDQQIAIVARRVERFARLATSGTVAQTQLEDARAELDGLHDRRAALDRVRQEPEALVAPVDGVVAQAAAVAGQMAAPGTQVFQIVDPARLWVEALSFEALSPAGDATARLADARALPLAYRGTGLADRNQAVPVQFAVTGDPSGLRIGQFVTVLAAIDVERAGIALPRDAVVRTGAGQDVVYEHVAAERFEARPVRVEPLDGARVLVADGIGPGRRIVTQGAELLDQVR